MYSYLDKTTVYLLLRGFICSKESSEDTDSISQPQQKAILFFKAGGVPPVVFTKWLNIHVTKKDEKLIHEIIKGIKSPLQMDKFLYQIASENCSKIFGIIEKFKTTLMISSDEPSENRSNISGIIQNKMDEIEPKLLISSKLEVYNVIMAMERQNSNAQPNPIHIEAYCTCLRARDFSKASSIFLPFQYRLISNHEYINTLNLRIMKFAIESNNLMAAFRLKNRSIYIHMALYLLNNEERPDATTTTGTIPHPTLTPYESNPDQGIVDINLESIVNDWPEFYRKPCENLIERFELRRSSSTDTGSLESLQSDIIYIIKCSIDHKNNRTTALTIVLMKAIYLFVNHLSNEINRQLLIYARKFKIGDLCILIRLKFHDDSSTDGDMINDVNQIPAIELMIESVIFSNYFPLVNGRLPSIVIEVIHTTNTPITRMEKRLLKKVTRHIIHLYRSIGIVMNLIFDHDPNILIEEMVPLWKEVLDWHPAIINSILICESSVFEKINRHSKSLLREIMLNRGILSDLFGNYFHVPDNIILTRIVPIITNPDPSPWNRYGLTPFSKAVDAVNLVFANVVESQRRAILIKVYASELTPEEINQILREMGQCDYDGLTNVEKQLLREVELIWLNNQILIIIGRISRCFNQCRACCLRMPTSLRHNQIRPADSDLEID